MEIRANRSELLAELVPMQGIVERKTTIPVLSHLLLSARQDHLHLSATDLDVSLTSTCDADVKSEGSIAVQGEPVGGPDREQGEQGLADGHGRLRCMSEYLTEHSVAPPRGTDATREAFSLVIPPDAGHNRRDGSPSTIEHPPPVPRS